MHVATANVCTCGWVQVCTCVCVHMYFCACVYLCMCACVYLCMCARVRHLHVLHCARLSLTQHAEQQQDQLFDVLQRLLLGLQVGVYLVQYLQRAATHTTFDQ